MAAGRNLLRGKHDVAHLIGFVGVAIPELSDGFAFGAFGAFERMIDFHEFFMERAAGSEVEWCRRRWRELCGRIEQEGADGIPMRFDAVHESGRGGLPDSRFRRDGIFGKGAALFVVVGGGPGQNVLSYLVTVLDGAFIYLGRHADVFVLCQYLLVERVNYRLRKNERFAGSEQGMHAGQRQAVFLAWLGFGRVGQVVEGAGEAGRSCVGGLVAGYVGIAVNAGCNWGRENIVYHDVRELFHGAVVEFRVGGLLLVVGIGRLAGLQEQGQQSYDDGDASHDEKFEGEIKNRRQD
jgi:hypothetical protein